MQPSEGELRRRLITAHGLATAAQLLTFVAAFLGIFAAVLHFAAVAGGLALVLYVWSLVMGRRERRGMQSRVERLADAVDIDHVLRETAISLGLRRGTEGWRLSLYRLEFGAVRSEPGLWKLEARAASQRVYELSDDLAQMSLEQGVLRTAVVAADSPLGGIDIMPQVPDRAADPEGWSKVMGTWGFSAADLAGGPVSRAYCGRAFRVGLSRGKGHDMTLGLVAESENPTGVERQAIEEVLTRPVFELLYELIRLREDMRVELSRFGGVSV